MTIKNDGKVGIGVTSASVKTHIKGVDNNANTNIIGLSPSTTDNVQGGLGCIAGGELRVNGNNYVTLATVSAERARIDDLGYLRLSANSPGIQFNGDTAAANALDDYEEGTFVPVISGTTTSGTGTYTTQIGEYTKVGNLVSFWLSLTWTAHTGTGNMNIDGLPFAVGQESATSGYNSNITLTANHYLQTYTATGLTRVVLRSVATGGGTISAVALDTAGTINVSGHYRV
jgi:hypothetical protein